MNNLTKEFIIYWSEYGEEGPIADHSGEIGDWVCKYAENQDQVIQVLNEIDDFYESIEK